MPINFEHIQGPASSKASNFEKLCSQLLCHEFPETRVVDGAGGDQGLDTFVGHLYPNSEISKVFQFKYFTRTLTSSQKRQVVSSLSKAVELFNPRDWVLCIPKSLTPAEHKWFDELSEQFPDTTLHCLDEVRLRALILRYDDVRTQFFPNAFTEEQLKQFRGIVQDIVTAVPGDLSFLIRISEIAKQRGMDPYELQADILDWCKFVESPFDMGLRSLLAGDFADAIASLERSISKESTSIAHKYILLGNAYFGNGDSGHAKLSFQKAIDLDGESIPALNNMGVSCRLLGNLSKALECYDKAIVLESKNAHLHNNRGVAQECQNNLPAAIESYSRALEIDPDCFPALYNRAMAVGLSGNFNASVADFEAAIVKIRNYGLLETMGAGNRLFPYKSLVRLLKEHLAPELRERYEERRKNGSSLGPYGESPTTPYALPAALTAEVVESSLFMFYNFCPRTVEALRTYITEYCQNRSAHWTGQDAFGPGEWGRSGKGSRSGRGRKQLET